MRDYFVNYENSDLMSVMSLDIYSYEAPLITSVDIGQELDWQDLGDPNAGGLAYFNLATLVDGGVTGARALIDVKGFHIGVKKNVDVPEPAPIILLAFGLFVIRLRRGKNTKAKGVEVILFLQTYLINLKSVRLRETLALIGLETK
ncbi:MAG: PEP-CTERM sorting domain-containing protein [Pseudomonadota bacterium]